MLLALGSLPVVMLPLTLVACGSGDDSSTADTGFSPEVAARFHDIGSELTGARAKQAEASVLRYLDARAAAEWGKACSYLTKPSRNLLGGVAAQSKQIRGGSCAAALATYTKRLSPSERAALGKADVRSVRGEGDRGFVLTDEPAGAERAMAVNRVGARWRVVSINGFLLGEAG